MIAGMYRFYHNSQKKEKLLSPDISVDEFEIAENILLRLIQKKSFWGRTGPKLKVLRSLENKNGFLKAKASIIHSNDKEDFRYPVILPLHQTVFLKLIYGETFRKPSYWK